VVWLLVPLAYLAGSVQWGLIIVRLTHRLDIRTVGSGKTGMTNVLRTSGKLPAAAVLLGDAAKGLMVVVAARMLTEHTPVHAVTAGAAIAGHVWPVFAGFRGGRGVSTGMGTTVMLDPWAMLIGILVFLPTVAVTRYVSLGSVLSVVTVTATFGLRAAFYGGPMAYVVFSVVCGTLIIAMHRDNIRRLLAGTERKVGQRVA
jgi:glycerol-3-phosphate acyltransferase PlsY